MTTTSAEPVRRLNRLQHVTRRGHPDSAERTTLPMCVHARLADQGLGHML
ncbi:hypothetical protein WEI85_29765 [Actinomycetes bacterium KLBMP 9797]